jgi:hypothetical protein
MLSSNRPQTCAEQGWQKGKEDIRGWFILPRGCPPKRKLPEDSTIKKSRTAEKQDKAAAAVPNVSSSKQTGKCYGTYKKWCSRKSQEDLQAHLDGSALESLAAPIACSTLYSAHNRLLEKKKLTQQVCFLWKTARWRIHLPVRQIKQR